MNPVIKLPQNKDASKYVVAECEIAPGKMASVKLPREVMTAYGLAKLGKRADGSFYPLFKTWQGKVRLTDDLPERLGLEMDSATLRTLCYAGFVAASRPSPFVTLIDVQSLLNHIEATEGDAAAEFWTEENRRKYRQAYHLGGMRIPRYGPESDPGQMDLFPDNQPAP